MGTNAFIDWSVYFSNVNFHFSFTDVVVGLLGLLLQLELLLVRDEFNKQLVLFLFIVELSQDHDFFASSSGFDVPVDIGFRELVVF